METQALDRRAERQRKHRTPPCERYATIQAWVAHTLPVKIYILVGYAYKFAALAAIISIAAGFIAGREFSPSLEAVLIGSWLGTAAGIITIELAYYIHREECHDTCRNKTSRHYKNRISTYTK